jgi:hypothetical protein
VTLAPVAANILRQTSKTTFLDQDKPGLYQRLISANPLEVCAVALGALDRRSELEVERFLGLDQSLGCFLVDLVGDLRDEASADRLRAFRRDPELAKSASAAIRKIETRAIPE